MSPSTRSPQLAPSLALARTRPGRQLWAGFYTAEKPEADHAAALDRYDRLAAFYAGDEGTNHS